MLPDDYLRKLKQDLAESDAAEDSATRREPEPDEAPPVKHLLDSAPPILHNVRVESEPSALAEMR
jgi:hypothetical protein